MDLADDLFGNLDADSEDEGKPKKGYKVARTAMIMLVDCSPSMFQSQGINNLSRNLLPRSCFNPI